MILRRILRRLPAVSAVLLAAALLAWPPVPARGQTNNPPPMCGLWVYRSQMEQMAVQLNSDGSYVSQYANSQGSNQFQGRWYFTGDLLVFQPQNGQTEQYKAGMLDANTLAVQFMNQQGQPVVLYLARQQGQTQMQPQQQPQQQYQQQVPQQQYPQQVPQQQYPQPQYQQQVPQQQVQPPNPLQVSPYAVNQGQTPPKAVYKSPIPAQQVNIPDPVQLVRYVDNTEQAFHVLIPKGWIARGGVLRVDPGQAGGPANSMEAKIDFAVLSDQQGTVAGYILPSYYYTTLGGSMIQNMFPEGSFYYGMEVLRLMTPQEFAIKKAFPYVHPHAGQPQVVAQVDLPELATAYRLNAGRMQGGNFVYKAGMVEYQYQENGRTYQERMVVVIEDRGYMVAGQWSNCLTYAARAPLGQLDGWSPLLQAVADSFGFEKDWIKREIRSQVAASNTVANVEDEVNRIDAEITKHRQETNAIINNDMYMALTDQEYYTDPVTHQVEQAPRLSSYRLKGPQGEVYYTNNPMLMDQLQKQGFYQTPTRQQ